MKVGDTFYFVDTTLGKVSKRKIVELILPCTQGKSESVSFANGIKTHPTYVHINPKPENYFTSHTKFYGSIKTYFIFTEVEDAQKCLIDYVLPKMLEVQQVIAENIRNQYQKVIDKSERIEEDLKKNTKDFDKKCNALKNKFV